MSTPALTATPIAGLEVCRSPRCSEPTLTDGRFCATHQEILDRVAGELGTVSYRSSLSGAVERHQRRKVVAA